MIHFELDVPESRQVTLPRETPTGSVHVTLSLNEPTGADVAYVRPAEPAVAIEFETFLQLLPILRSIHGGHYVAVRSGRVIASGLDLDGVLKLAKVETAGAPFFCGWVEPPDGYVFRSGKVVVVPDAGAA